MRGCEARSARRSDPTKRIKASRLSSVERYAALGSMQARSPQHGCTLRSDQTVFPQVQVLQPCKGQSQTDSEDGTDSQPGDSSAKAGHLAKGSAFVCSLSPDPGRELR